MPESATQSEVVFMRESSTEQKHARKPDDFFSGSRRYFDASMQATMVNVHAGDSFITNQEDEIAATVLGSCISACIRDPIMKVGGMNHFLLPGTTTEQDTMRFGAFAMEKLINEILKRGGRRERLEIKLFGGGNVIQQSTAIGTKNIAFARQYLADEELRIISEDVGGTWPRKVRYQPFTGRAWVMKLRRDEDYDNVRKAEERYTRTATQKNSGAVELF
jgi:chemotaxis protein CheD